MGIRNSYCQKICSTAHGRRGLHILDDRRRKLRCLQLGGAGHQPLQVVGHALLLNGARDAVFDQLGRLPSSP